MRALYTYKKNIVCPYHTKQANNHNELGECLELFYGFAAHWGSSGLGYSMQLLRLISPVIGVTIASLGALATLALLFANSLDSTSLKGERRLLSGQVERISQNLKTLVEDNTWWDDAVMNLVLSENQEWLEATVGDTVVGFVELDGTIVFRPDNSVMYTAVTGDSAPSPDSFLNAGLDRAIRNLLPVDADEPVSNHGYLLVENQLFAVGISMVQPAGHITYDPPLGSQRRPVMVFYRAIDPGVLTSIKTAIGIQNLRFQRDPSTDKSALVLKDMSNDPVGQFVWEAAQPGADILSRLIWPALFFVLVILATLLIFVWRARRLIRGLEKADRAKSAFLASMSHEVRTPLNAIIGFTEILRLELHGEIKGDKNKEYLDIIRTSSENLLMVINDILDISKLDAGKMEIYAEDLDPTEIITGATKLLETEAHDRSIRLVTELEPATIQSDARIIRQILINLLSNAVKFTKKGGQVSVRSETATDGYRIIVSDTGVGMSGEDIEVALAPFGQVITGQKDHGGTGLGLPLVNRFITLIGGKMTIRSAPGHGTSVIVHLPPAAPKKSSESSVPKALLH